MARAPATAPSKLSPPPAPAAWLPRPRLDALLTDALARRLTIVVADAGFGKTTTLAGWAGRVPSAWYTVTSDDRVLATLARGLVDALRLRLPALPADLAGILAGTRGPDASLDERRSAQVAAATLAQSLDQSVTRDLLVVLDDVHELGGEAVPTAFLEALALQAPPGLHLVLASRGETRLRVERLRGQGQVLDVDAADLRLDVDEVEALIDAVGVTTPTGAAPAIHEACSGWPAAVRLAIEAVGRAPAEEAQAVLDRVRRPGGSLYGYLAAEVLSLERPEVRQLLQTVAPLGAFTPELCEALGVADAGSLLVALARSGVFVEPRGRGVGWYSLTTPVREYALASLPVDPGTRAHASATAAAWLEEHGSPDAAVALLVDAGDGVGVADLLERHGQRLLAGGAVATLERALDALPDDLLTPPLARLAGDVRQRRGDWDGAIARYRRAAPPGAPLPDDVAWRLGLIHHLRGHLEDALEVYRSASGADGATRDHALLLAWRASALWLRGEIDACREDADAAFAAATETDDAQALAAAHTVLAMLAATDGDRGANDAHYLRALDHAERAGDVLQLIRVRTNRGSRHLEEGAYEEAIEELDHALRLADLAGFASFRALALTNRGEAQFRLGRLEQAVADLETARQLYERLGSRLVAYPLEKVAGVYRERGAWAPARAAYEQAIGQAEAASDRQGLVPALAGLARVLAGEDPAAAAAAAEQALATGPGMHRVEALLAGAWVALAAGDAELAAARADEAATEARARRDRAGLAEALELEGLAADDDGARDRRLAEAIAIWSEIRSPVGTARAKLEHALGLGDRAAAAAAETSLRELGAHGALSLVTRVAHAPAADVEIRTLGRFAVLRGGEPVPVTAWQSRKARDLLKILVARRGRPVTRDALMEALWPEEDPRKLSNRLSVALSTARAVLDPGKRHPADWFVVSDRAAARVDLDHVHVDLEAFLAAAEEGLRAPAGDTTGELLARAEALYSGDFLEEDAYEEWAIVPREEARAVHVDVLRALAESAAAAGRVDAAARYALRLLERDPYDERAHLGLVSSLDRAGRHGEARRAYGAYCARMAEIDVESAPFPARDG